MLKFKLIGLRIDFLIFLLKVIHRIEKAIINFVNGPIEKTFNRISYRTDALLEVRKEILRDEYSQHLPPSL